MATMDASSNERAAQKLQGLLHIPFTKCVLGHEVYDLYPLCFYVEWAVKVVENEMDNEPILKLASYIGEDSYHYWEVKSCLREIIASFHLSPIHGEVAAKLIMLCMLDGIILGNVPALDGNHQLRDFAQDWPNIEQFRLFEDFYDRFWHSNGSQSTSKLISELVQGAREVIAGSRIHVTTGPQMNRIEVNLRASQ